MALLVCSLALVPQQVAAHRPSRMISLLDPQTPFPTGTGLGPTEHLRLELHDVDHDGGTLDTVVPALDHVDAVLRFADGWDRTAPLLVHCWAGISRSTATAFIIACAQNPSTPETQIAQSLRAASPTATPNRRLVALADATLGRQGRMVDAIAGIGRGPDWWDVEAAPFTLPSRFDQGPS